MTYKPPMVKPKGNAIPHPDKRIARPTTTASILANPASLELTVSEARLEAAPAGVAITGSCMSPRPSMPDVPTAALTWRKAFTTHPSRCVSTTYYNTAHVLGNKWLKNASERGSALL